MSRFSTADIEAIKASNPVDAVAGQWVKLRRKGRAGKYVGPCPFCSEDGQSRGAGRFECDAFKWVCAVCPDGGDVIRLVARRNGLDDEKDFVAILELLGGTRQHQDTPDTARRAGASAFRAGKAIDAWPADWNDDLKNAFRAGWNSGKAQADANDRYRERERDRLHKNFWKQAAPIGGTPVAEYLKRRGLQIPRNATVRFLDDCPMFADGKEVEPVIVWRGPVMLCPIWGPDPKFNAETHARGEGYRFAGLHFTWIDLSQAKGKAIVRDAESGEILPAKKARGSKQGGYIDLGGCPAHLAERVICGEGVENTLAAYTALVAARRDISRTHFRCGIDLGNLAGKALDRVTHPTLKTEAGRSRVIPGVVPDMASPAMPLPIGTWQVVWMCDGDSDPVTTQNAMARVKARHARADLLQKFLWPGAGLDWNDRVMT